jgi:hypothetical protein
MVKGGYMAGRKKEEETLPISFVLFPRSALRGACTKI